MVKVNDETGATGWISKLNAQGLRTIGTLQQAQVFPTRDDARREIERLSDHLPSHKIRFKIERE